MATHYLKTVQPYFDEIKQGNKRFEFRKNDRDFQVGDEVYLQEYDKETDTFSGKEVRGTITYVLKDWEGLDHDFCVFSFRVTQHIALGICDHSYVIKLQHGITAISVCEKCNKRAEISTSNSTMYI
jgi:hypothetical protein